MILLQGMLDEVICFESYLVFVLCHFILTGTHIDTTIIVLLLFFLVYYYY
jgi:hypothetical protein